MSSDRDNLNGCKHSNKTNDSPEVPRFKLNKQGRPVISSSSLRGMPVHNDEGVELGVLSEIMIEMQRGTVAYAVLKFEDKKLFALPYSMLKIDLDEQTICANVQREVFEHGRGMSLKQDGQADRQT